MALTGTHAYFSEWNERFPFLVFSRSGGVATSSWFFGGRTASEYWRTYAGGLHHSPASGRPLNPYIAGVRVADDDDVPSLRCPSDSTSYQRLWDRAIPTNVVPDPRPAYLDVGTSYHFNYLGARNVEGNGIPLNLGTNWEEYYSKVYRLLIQDAFAHFPSRFVLFFEDPANYGVGSRVEKTGNHGFLSRHSVGFLDGHARHIDMDTSRWCGPKFTVINPRWVVRPDFTPSVRYSEFSGKTCDP